METHINTKVPLLHTLFFVRMVIEANGPDDSFQLHVTGGGTYEAYLDVVELTGSEIPAFKVKFLFSFIYITYSSLCTIVFIQAMI